MNIETQLVSFATFFAFGCLLALVDEFFFTKKRLLIYPTFIALSLIFMGIIYHINGGIIHEYFLIVFLIGILVSKIAVKYIKKHLYILKLKRNK